MPEGGLRAGPHEVEFLHQKPRHRGDSRASSAPQGSCEGGPYRGMRIVLDMGALGGVWTCNLPEVNTHHKCS